MTYEQFIRDSLASGLLKKQASDPTAVRKMIRRARVEIRAARANLAIDAGIAYTTAYLSMLHTARAFMLVRGFRPADGYQHRTAVAFMGFVLGSEFGDLADLFDRMRRKRNLFTYEVDPVISDTEAHSAVDTAGSFVELAEKLIRQEFPQTDIGL